MKDEERKALSKNASCNQLIEIMSEEDPSALNILKNIYDVCVQGMISITIAKQTFMGDDAFTKIIDCLDESNIRGKQIPKAAEICDNELNAF
ncbi:MAG: hypothetical protein ACOY3I_05535 [Verrucomicrobiota bacterium]